MKKRRAQVKPGSYSLKVQRPPEFDLISVFIAGFLTLFLLTLACLSIYFLGLILSDPREWRLLIIVIPFGFATLMLASSLWGITRRCASFRCTANKRMLVVRNGCSNSLYRLERLPEKVEVRISRSNTIWCLTAHMIQKGRGILIVPWMLYSNEELARISAKELAEALESTSLFSAEVIDARGTLQSILETQDGAR